MCTKKLGNQKRKSKKMNNIFHCKSCKRIKENWLILQGRFLIMQEKKKEEILFFHHNQVNRLRGNPSLIVNQAMKLRERKEKR